MDQLFAPWRIEWVERDDGAFEGCPFCAIPEADDTDREHNLLVRGEEAYVLLNSHPYNPGHAMVVPYEHTGEYRDLGGSALLEKERLVQRTIEAMDTAVGPDGYNVGYNLGGGAAGGSIDDHIHAHVIPRWDGDTNFMATVGETSVIVEAVAETYDRLHGAFARQDGVTSTGDDRAVVVDI